MLKKVLVSSIALAVLVSVAPGALLAANTTNKGQTRKAENAEKVMNTQKEERVQANILKRELRQGMSGEEVTALQELLAANPDVYPEGLITGYYGSMTARAVMKFQEKYGIDSVGLVGPRTRAKLNELANNPDTACRAWGLRIAPGQLKKTVGAESIDLSGCANIPKGISDKLNGDWRTGSSTASTTASTTLKISNIRVTDITDDEVTLKWSTSVSASTTVWYSTDEELDDAEDEELDSMGKTHEVTLDDLEAETEYFYRIVATDSLGRTATSSIRSFETEED